VGQVPGEGKEDTTSPGTEKDRLKVKAIKKKRKKMILIFFISLLL